MLNATNSGMLIIQDPRVHSPELMFLKTRRGFSECCTFVRTSRSQYTIVPDRKSQEKDFVYRLRNTYNTSLLEISYCYNDCTFSFPFCFYSHLFVIDIPITYPRRQPHYLSCEQNTPFPRRQINFLAKVYLVDYPSPFSCS